MATYISNAGQTPANICLQLTGGLNQVVELARINGKLSLVDQVPPGTEITIEGLSIENRTLVDYYLQNNVIIATYGG